MNNIKKRHFRILIDFPLVYDFMVSIYNKNWTNGVPAPFFEYARCSDWADQTLTHRNAVWEDDGKIVAFCFYEDTLGTAFFSLDPKYDFLSKDMIIHAEKNLCDYNGNLKLQLFDAQASLILEAEKRGYKVIKSYTDKIFDFKNELSYTLPEGFHFVSPSEINIEKLLLCCYKGFNHENEYEFIPKIDNGLRLNLSPNATPQYNVVIADTTTSEYVCHAGMWWVPENKLAYMEPLCTIPDYRKKGLAKSALSEMANRMRPLGAEYMTGGASEFYANIGFEDAIKWISYKKEK